MDPDRLTEEVIGAAIAVHRAVGPGLLESAYEPCLGLEFMDRRIPFKRQHPLRLIYRGHVTECAYRLDNECRQVSFSAPSAVASPSAVSALHCI